MALDKNLQKLERLLSLMDSDSLTKEDFIKAFEKVVDLVLKIQKEQQEALAGLEKTYQALLKRVQSEHSTSLSELKGKTNQLFVGEKLEEMGNNTKKSFNELKTMINDSIDKRLDEVDFKVANIKPVKGDRGDPGISGPTSSKEEMNIALKPIIEPIIEDFKKTMEERISNISRGRWLGSGQSTIVPRPMISISTDTTPAISGAINGSNTAYVLPKAPVKRSGEPFAVKVYLNGTRQREGSSNDYTVVGKTFTMASAPLTGDIIVCDLYH